MSESNFANDKEGSPSLQSVEKLLKSMSLKKPPSSFEQNVLAYSHRSNRRYVRELVVALACLLSGVLVGRVLPVSDSESDSVNFNETEVTSPMPSWGLADQNLANFDGATIGLVDEGFCLINGEMPARKYSTVANKKLVVIDPESGKPVEITVPIRKTVLSASIGT